MKAHWRFNIFSIKRLSVQKGSLVTPQYQYWYPLIPILRTGSAQLLLLSHKFRTIVTLAPHILDPGVITSHVYKQ